MNFNELSNEEKTQLKAQLMPFVEIVGGINPFLTMIEEIRAQKPKALLNKTAIYHTSNTKFTWGKTIFKDTLNLLHSSMINEEKTGNIFDNLTPSVYKNTMNMIRTIKPIQVTMISKKDEREASFMILDTTIEKRTKVTILFKIFFFYSIDFAKQVLMFKTIEE